MKYEKEIDDVFRDLIYEDWMSEEDYQDIMKESFEASGISKEKLSSDLEEGIKNGFPLEQQLELIKFIIK